MNFPKNFMVQFEVKLDPKTPNKWYKLIRVTATDNNKGTYGDRVFCV